MDGLGEYIRNIFCIYIVLSMVENLISSDKYIKYIKLFGGIIMVIAVIKPIASLLGNVSLDPDVGIFDRYGLSDEVYADILNAERGRNDEIIGIYTSSILERAGTYAADGGYEVVNGSVELNLDESSSDYGSVELIRLDLVKPEQRDETEIYDTSNAAFYDYNLITLKNNLANFYNLPQSNIYINIYSRQDYKEGARD